MKYSTYCILEKLNQLSEDLPLDQCVEWHNDIISAYCKAMYDHCPLNIGYGIYKISKPQDYALNRYKVDPNRYNNDWDVEESQVVYGMVNGAFLIYLYTPDPTLLSRAEQMYHYLPQDDLDDGDDVADDLDEDDLDDKDDCDEDDDYEDGDALDDSELDHEDLD